jgi:hypothetical protein
MSGRKIKSRCSVEAFKYKHVWIKNKTSQNILIANNFPPLLKERGWG